MMMVQYLLDADEPVAIPAVEAPQGSFPDVVRPCSWRSTRRSASPAQIQQLAIVAREEGDLVAEQFMHWFLQEQREVSSMSSLLDVVTRSKDNVMHVETSSRGVGRRESPSRRRPPAAGGALDGV